MIVTLLNNRFLAKKDAKISIFSDSFTRGFGVFETLRTFGDKKVFKAGEHIDRLFDSAKKIDLKINYSKTSVTKMLSKAIEKSPHRIQRIKIIAILEGTIIISSPLRIDEKIYDGVICKSINCTRSLPEVKSISYLPSFLTHEKAVKQGCHEAILIDGSGEVYEGAYSNIFWFEGNTLCTRDNNVLRGIIRQAVLRISTYPKKFKTIRINSLYKKSEVFLTSSITGIVPVTMIDSKKIGNARVGARTKHLMGKLLPFFS